MLANVSKRLTAAVSPAHLSNIKRLAAAQSAHQLSSRSIFTTTRPLQHGHDENHGDKKDQEQQKKEKETFSEPDPQPHPEVLESMKQELEDFKEKSKYWIPHDDPYFHDKEYAKMTWKGYSLLAVLILVPSSIYLYRRYKLRQAYRDVHERYDYGISRGRSR
eukprot:GEZU01009297.1.p1 GENE.GEZU01009297.1~~GEZU01009297.1.p1  ORF type:complete len:162 (+),score=28.03 GEZU01009297.1:58-543(+)